MLLNLDLDHYKQLNADKTDKIDTESPDLNRPFDIYTCLLKYFPSNLFF